MVACAACFTYLGCLMRDRRVDLVSFNVWHEVSLEIHQLVQKLMGCPAAFAVVQCWSEAHGRGELLVWCLSMCGIIPASSTRYLWAHFSCDTLDEFWVVRANCLCNSWLMSLVIVRRTGDVFESMSFNVRHVLGMSLSIESDHHDWDVASWHLLLNSVIPLIKYGYCLCNSSRPSAD